MRQALGSCKVGFGLMEGLEPSPRFEEDQTTRGSVKTNSLTAYKTEKSWNMHVG